MWAGETMTFLESVVASLLGLSVVFCTLIALAVAIIVISKILGLIIKDDTTKPAAAAAAPVSDEADKEIFAVLMSVISEDLNLPMDQFKIVEIREI